MCDAQTWWLAVAQNIMSVITDDDNKGDDWSKIMLTAGILQTIFAFFRFASFCFWNGPLAFHRFQVLRGSGNERWLRITDHRS